MALAVIGIVAWIGALIFLWKNRIFFFFYVLGAVGLAFWLVIIGTRWLPLELILERYTAYHVHAICQVIGIPTRVFEAAPGNILVLVVVQEPGWTVVKVGVECSGLLEGSVLLGLFAFYPGLSWRRRGGLTALGLILTYVANLVRVLFIVLVLHYFGKRSIFVAHTILGRVIFFAAVALLYWWLLTRPTIEVIRQQIQERWQR